MALRWLKPLEQGFDVKIVAGTHGGCMRVLTRTSSGVDKLADLKGKIVAVGDLAGPDKNFFSIQLAKLGIDPNKDVDWRPYPGNLLNLAVEKGEVQAFLASDPLAHLWLKDTSTRKSPPIWMASTATRAAASSGSRQPGTRRAAGRARHHAGVLDAAMFTSQNPEKAAKSFQPYAPKAATLADLEAMARYHTHHHHPVGDVLKRELKAYADDLKTFRSSSPAPIRQNSRRRSMSTYSVSDAISVEGSRASSSRGSDRRLAEKLRIGVAAPLPGSSFGLSCLWWPDLGDWSRTYALGIAAFVVAAVALFGTLSADFLGPRGPPCAAGRRGLSRSACS